VTAFGLSEAEQSAARCSDIIRQHIVNGNAGRWAAIRLSDGGSDGIAYESKALAVRFQLHEFQCAYVKIPADDMSPRHALSFLRINRNLYDAGFRISDPDREVILPDKRY
jgi:hypothetical protein